jgi:HAMP domain-containing protein
VTNIVKVFGRANDQLNKVGLGVTPMKALEYGAKGTSKALEGVSAGLTAVGTSANAASKAVPVLGSVATAANVTAVAATGLSKSMSGLGTVAGAANFATSWRGMFLGMTAVTVAAYLFSKAIGTAIEQLAKMVEIADKAAKVNVSPRFFQEFVLESEKLKVSANALEGALKGAFDAAKQPDPIDLSKWDFGTEKLTETEKILRVMKAELKDFEGLELFRNAPDQDERIKAVLKAMKELEDRGRNIEALQLGESFFKDKQFIDALRRGETSVTKILATMEEARKTGVGIIPDELLERAKEINKELKLAQNQLSREMKPLWSDLNRLVLNIEQTWVRILDVIGRVLGAFNRFSVDAKTKELAIVEAAIARGETSIRGETPMLTEAQEALPDRAARLRQELIDSGATPTGAGRLAIGVAKPPAASAKLKPKPDEGETKDKLDTAIDTLEKRTAALNAETEAIDLGTEARERARITAELETIAKQVNTAAGLENTAVSAEQAEKINLIADAYAKAAKAAEDAKGPIRTFAREAANANRQIQEAMVSGLKGLEDALLGIITKSTTAEEAFKKLADALIADLIRIGIRLAITGPLAQAFGGALGLSGGNPIAPLPPNPPQFAEGGYLGAGKWGIAGENGPELIRGPAQIVSNPVMRGMAASASGGSGVNVVVNSYNADVQTERRDDKALEITVRGLIRDEISGGRTNQIMRGKYGLSPRGIARP